MGSNILSGLDRIRITQTRLFIEEFLHCSCFDNKVCLLLDGQADMLRFITVVICKSNVDFFSDAFSDKEVLFNNQSQKHDLHVK